VTRVLGCLVTLVLVMGDRVIGEGDMVTRDHGDPGDPVILVMGGSGDPVRPETCDPVTPDLRSWCKGGGRYGVWRYIYGI